MSAAVIAELEIGDLPASNGTIMANLRRRCGDHELALVVKDQGSTENKNRREPRNTPNTRKDNITAGGFISVCSVCSVVKKNGIAAQPKITCWSGFASPSASHYNQVGGKANDTRASTV